jgi:hypothetical protein
MPYKVHAFTYGTYGNATVRVITLAACMTAPLALTQLLCLCRAYGSLDNDTYSNLNPLALCGILPPAPLVCVGGKLAPCSNVHNTAAGDTCSSIEANVGTIIGPGDLNCSGLVPGTPVCVRPAANLVSARL